MACRSTWESMGGKRHESNGCTENHWPPDKILGFPLPDRGTGFEAEKTARIILVWEQCFPLPPLDAEAVSFETLKNICAAVSIPVVAIGGINKDNAIKLSGSGTAGITVVSAIFAQDDIARLR